MFEIVLRGVPKTKRSSIWHTQVKKNQIYSIKSLSEIRQNSVPNCPYTHSKCVRYNPYKQRGICQNHGNKNAKSIRCPSLPYFISNGWRIAVLKGGRLHV